MIRGVVKKVVRAVFDRPLPPPSPDEQGFLAELAATFRALPVVNPVDLRPSEALWQSYVNDLKEVVLHENPREFLRADVVSKSMFIGFAGYIWQELQYLKRRPDWAARWRTAIEETAAGHPVPYVFYPRSSANLIHHAYHVARFEAQTGLRVDTLELIVEFGGGYGSMCRLLHRLGFAGKYVLFDFAPISALQRYYLKTLGLPVKTPAEFAASNTGIVCVSSYEDLRTVLASSAAGDRALFVGTWSLSEAPTATRDAVLAELPGCAGFLLAFHHRFEEVDNVAWFDALQASKPGVTWTRSPIEQPPGNFYLFGRPRVSS